MTGLKEGRPEKNLDQVKLLREMTGAGVMDCTQALREAKGDLTRAQEILRQKGAAIAQKKSGRTAKEGQVFSYVHLGGKIGVLVEINCETDFVARNGEFQQFGRDIAMQVAAAQPLFVSREQADPKWIEGEKRVFAEQVKDKPAAMQEKIIQGKIDKRFEEVCLLDQKFIRDDKKTIQNLLTELISKFGEHVAIRRFSRFELGSE